MFICVCCSEHFSMYNIHVDTIVKQIQHTEQQYMYRKEKHIYSISAEL